MAVHTESYALACMHIAQRWTHRDREQHSDRGADRNNRDRQSTNDGASEGVTYSEGDVFDSVDGMSQDGLEMGGDKVPLLDDAGDGERQEHADVEAQVEVEAYDAAERHSGHIWQLYEVEVDEGVDGVEQLLLRICGWQAAGHISSEGPDHGPD